MSSETAHSDPVRRYHEGTLHDTWGELLSQDNANWLSGRDTSVDSIVRVERLRRENSPEYVEIMAAIHDDATRRVLFGVVEAGGTATYDDLANHVAASRRTLKKRVYDLSDRGVLTVEDTKPAVMHFPSDAIALLVKDGFSVYFE